MPALRRSIAGIVALGLGLGGALVVAAPAQAAVDSYTVTNASGDASVVDSLPWAVAQAELDPGHSDIIVPAGAAITLLANLVITTDVTITGPGAANRTITGAAGAPGDAVFGLSGNGPVRISGLTIAPAVGGSAHGIYSIADSLTLADLSLAGFSDDNIGIDSGAVDASGITTSGSGHDGFSYTGFAGETASIRSITSDGNGDYGFVLGSGSGSLDASDLSATGNGAGVFVIGGSTTVTLTRVTTKDNDAEGVRIFASDTSATLTDVTSTGNGLDPCLCGGPGIVIDADTDSAVNIVGAAVSDNTAEAGAGIYLSSVVGGSTVSISGSTITGNHATLKYYSIGGGIGVEALEDAGSSLTITDSTISGNDATAGGGGIGLFDLGSGSPTGPVTITRTTIDGNTAEVGGGLFLENSSGTTTGDPDLTLRDSTVSNNTANEEGGGLYLYHDAADPDATVLVTGSTVSGNVALGATSSGNGGAIYVESAAGTTALTLDIEYSTIAANDPPGVGGVFVDGDGVALSLLSSIVAGNDRGDLSFPATIASFASAWSLVQDVSLAGLPLGPTNITGVDPQLGALANNGGPTRTMLITPSSPAFNAGNPAAVGAGLLDQRGQARVYQRIDMGAVEWHPALAVTGSTPEPEPPLIAVLLVLTGTAMVAFSRLQVARSVG